LNTDISQGSVIAQLRCGGIVNDDLPLNLPVKEFWKSVNIWRSYGQYYSGLFFIDSQCRKQKHCLRSAEPTGCTTAYCPLPQSTLHHMLFKESQKCL